MLCLPTQLPHDIQAQITYTSTEEESVKAAASKVKHQFDHSDNHLRLAFAIPGILHAEKSPAQINYDLALQTFKINTLGPMLLMKHFCQFLPRKATHNLTDRKSTRLNSSHWE